MSQDTIILCASPPVIKGIGNNFTVSGSMIPVNGKPIIGRILDDLITKGITSVIIVHQATDFQLNEFLQLVYGDRLTIKYVAILSNGNIVDSLRKGLEASSATEIRVILGDTLITDPSPSNKSDFIFVHSVRDSSRWCICHYDEQGLIQGFSDKQENVEGDLVAVCGYYYFSDSDLLRYAIMETVQKNHSEISNVLSVYNERKKIVAVPCENWFDFGNIDTFFISKARLISGRYFNQLQVDPILNTIKKKSLFNEKLENELNWYLKIPEELKVLSPRIVSYKIDQKNVEIIQEYYGYPTLAEIYLYYNLHQDVWSFMLNNLLCILDKIKSYKGDVSSESVYSMYIEKTEARIAELQDDEYWNLIFSKDKILLNNTEHRNLNSFTELLKQSIIPLTENAEGAIIHGDFCFSNILYDLNSHITRVIDPRGSFGEPGIYGDPRYDVAKLRHSVCGFYDFITADLFDLEEPEPGVFNLKIHTPETVRKISAKFDEIIQKYGYNLKEIKLIEALLFLSMLPLHKEKPLRQKVMFLRGISLLNEIFTDNAKSNENSHRLGWHHLSD